MDAYRGIEWIPVPAVWVPANLERRLSCERDLVKFATIYFPHLFYFPGQYHLDTLTQEQGYLLTNEPVVLKHAEAGPRGVGKTTLRIIESIWALLYGHSRMVLWVRKTLTGDEGAESRLKAIKNELLYNNFLCEDFPEICQWVRSFGGDPKRCRAPYVWQDKRLKFPGPKYCLAGSIESSLVGLNVEGVRPDLIIFDDLETRRTSGSDAEQRALRDSFNTDLIKIHDLNKRALYIQLGNIRTEKSLIAENCDRVKQPGWKGTVYKALTKKPDREDLWETFLDIFRGQSKPPDAAMKMMDDDIAEILGYAPQTFKSISSDAVNIRNAYAFYCLNKTAMDAGAELLDPLRLPLIRCYHTIADEGYPTFASEYQNEPPIKEEVSEAHLDLSSLRSKETRSPKDLVPLWASKLIATIDVGQSRMHWEVDAWNERLETSQVICCGIKDTGLYKDGRIDTARSAAQQHLLLSESLREALSVLRVRFEDGWTNADGVVFHPALVLVDCGGSARMGGSTVAWYGQIQRICREFGSRWMPSKGAKFQDKTMSRSMGRCWIIEEKDNPGMRIDGFTDYYKLLALAAYKRPSFREDGSVMDGTRLFHAGIPLEYLKHQTSEKLEEGYKEGRAADVAFYSHWVLRPKASGGYPKNHWWDTTWMQFLGAEYLSHRTRKQNPLKTGVVGSAFGFR